MERIIILSNLGSTSKKYSVYKNNIECAWFHIEKKDTEYICSYKIQSQFEKKHITQDVYDTALEYVVSELIEQKELKTKDDISTVAIRVVVPSIDFVQDMICTPQLHQKLKDLQEIDPLHIAPVVEELNMLYSSFSKKTQIVLISDSVFHMTTNTPIPLSFDVPLHTIGYHGLSCESVLSVLDKHSISYNKLVIVHLGGGSSVTGIRQKRSVYNSMQFSPVGGMLMSSRSGSIDPFLILLYMKEHNLSYVQMIDHLYSKSGLLALSGISSDLRIIREHALSGNAQAKRTIMFFVDSIVETIAQALTHTQGIDTLVFSGTIGIRATYIRELVIERLMWLGFVLNHNQNTESGDECFEISAYDSKIKIYVVHIDEMKEMYNHAQIILKNKI